MIENEEYIIGAILNDNSAMDKIYNVLKPEMFENRLYADIYRDMLRLHSLGLPIELTAIAQSIEDRENSRELVTQTIQRIAMATPVTAFVESYAKTVITDWKAREINNILRVVDTTPNKVDDTIGELITKLESLKASKKSPLKPLKVIVDENKDNYFNDRKDDSSVRTGIYQIDDMIVSFPSGTMSIIAARPGVGKTAFAIQMAKEQARAGKKIAIFSLEMGDSEQYERLISSESGIELTRIQKAKTYLGDEKERFTDGNENLSKLPIYMACGTFSVDEIYEQVRYQNFDIIIVDYLQLIEPDSKYNGNRVAEVGEISRGLKKIAMKTGIPVVALSQLNRLTTVKKDKEPDASELRESGSLEQDASIIILLWDLNDDDNCIYKGLKIAKCRHGKRGRIGLKFIGNTMTFEPRQEDFGAWKKRAEESAKKAPYEEVFQFE